MASDTPSLGDLMPGVDTLRKRLIKSRGTEDNCAHDRANQTADASNILSHLYLQDLANIGMLKDGRYRGFALYQSPNLTSIKRI
jgi:hypothetical protein